LLYVAHGYEAYAHRLTSCASPQIHHANIVTVDGERPHKVFSGCFDVKEQLVHFAHSHEMARSLFVVVAVSANKRSYGE
jgi:hypothetical protein